MEPVDLDFRATPASAARIGKALALLGVGAALVVGVMCGWLAMTGLDLEKQVRERREELRRQQDAGLAAVAIDPDGEIARRLAHPWQALLLAIESASDPRIALLEIRPDPARRQLRLSGEAAGLDDALGYLRRLQQLAELNRPHLVSHALVPASGGTMVLRFVIQAEWSGK